MSVYDLHYRSGSSFSRVCLTASQTMSTLFVFPDVAVASLLYAAVYIVTVTSSSLSKTLSQVLNTKRVYVYVTFKFCFSKFITLKTLTYCKSVKNRLMWLTLSICSTKDATLSKKASGLWS